MLILGIDPGGTTGFCIVSKNGNDNSTVAPISVGEIKQDKFNAWLDSWDILNLTHIVCEDFIARPGLTNGKWTSLPVAKQVGAISYRAHQLGVTYIELQPSDKPVGYKAAGLQYVKGKKGTHIHDATAHAFYVAKLGFKPTQRRF